MIFFRVVLCIIGLLLYLVIKEFSAKGPETGAGQDVLRPGPYLADDLRPPTVPWQQSTLGAFRPVSETRVAEPLR